MKAIHILIGVVLFLLVGAAAVALFWSALQGANAWAGWVDRAKDFHLTGLMASVAVLCLMLLYVLTGLSTPGRVQYLAYDNEGGAVSISLKAVEGFLSRLADEFAALVSLAPTLKTVNGSLDVQLDVKVKSGAQIPELCKLLQEAARSCIRDKVGISDIREVRVRVQEIVGPMAASGTASGEKSDGYVNAG